LILGFLVRAIRSGCVPSIFRCVEHGIVEVILRDRLKQVAGKLGFVYANCFRVSAQPGQGNLA
jgi:hypothetical protein